MENEVMAATVTSATRTRRFFNFFIDMIIYEVIMLFAVFPLMRAIVDPHVFDNFWVSFLFASIVQFAYYLMFEAWFQRTPGKFITGTKVVMADGSKPDLATLAKRTLTRIVPFNAISVYTGSEPDKKDTWWHDRWTATRVVQQVGRPEDQQIQSSSLPASPSEQGTISYGVRLLIMFGIVFLGCITLTSASSLLMVIISSITVGTRWTGNFWEDIFPFILAIAVTGAGAFGVFKLAQVLYKRS
jgi:uncharacterized RDD family membrane protein YckC